MFRYSRILARQKLAKDAKALLTDHATDHLTFEMNVDGKEISIEIRMRPISSTTRAQLRLLPPPRKA